MAEVILENVTKVFGDVTAVNNATLEVKDREFVVLVGPSGCGKTTTLRMVAGLEEITDGNIYIGGTLVNDIPPKDRDIAMVFQNYALYPHMDVYNNMAFGLKLRKFPRKDIEARVEEAASILGIRELLKRRPKQLSGGQRQRVAVGRAIVRHPKVFLFDEPLSNLDAKLRVQMRAELSRLHDRLQATIIYVTHDQVEAMTMGDRIVVMNEGNILQVDTPQELYDHPANRFVAGFIGSPSMNFFNTRVVKIKDDLWIDGESFKVKIPSDKARAMESFTNQDIIFGLRPEDISAKVNVPDADPDCTIKIDVDVVEPMGAELFVYAITGEHSFIARVEPHTPAEVGKPLELVFAMNFMHAFRPDTEEAIL